MTKFVKNQLRSVELHIINLPFWSVGCSQLGAVPLQSLEVQSLNHWVGIPWQLHSQ